MAFRLFGFFLWPMLLSKSPLKIPLLSPVFHTFILFFIAENLFFSIVYTDIVKFYLHLHTFSATSVE